MYGVIIENGPQNWQIFQQENGYAEISVSGRVEIEPNLWTEYNDHVIFLRITDENTNARIIEPVKIKPDEQHRFSATLKVPAGGPYRLETYLRLNGNWEKRGDRVFHLGVGDIYVIAGQSNAVGVGKDSVNDPISEDVHVFRTSGVWDIATHPLHDSTNTIFPKSMDTVQTGYSPWLNFGKILARRLAYPIGLIPAAQGGVPLEFWDRARDGRLFNNMLEMVKMAGGKIKGVLWYQGCNDTTSEDKRAKYFESFKSLVADFEKEFYKGIPILTVQLNKVVCTKDADVDLIGIQYADIREAQRKCAAEIENVYMVPSLDLMVCDGIHNSAMSTLVIGERAANTLLRYVYGKEAICDAPQINRAVLKDSRTIDLYFDNVYDLLFADLNCISTSIFSVTDSLGRIFPADYKCAFNDTITLIFDRDIADNAVVNCDRYNDTSLMPYDLFSYLPIVPFNGVKVQK